jgi:hypothetical protein
LRRAQAVVTTKADGIQIQTISLMITAQALLLEKNRSPIGETSIGVQGKKYRVLLNGARNATPKPPLVKASRTPCDAVATKK